MLGLAVVAWLDHLSRQAGRPDLAQLSGGSVCCRPVLAAVSAATVGAVLASRRPRAPGRLAAADPRPGPERQRGGRRLCGLRAGGPTRRPARRWPRRGPLRPGPLVLTALPVLSFVLLLTPTGSLPSPAGAGAGAIAVAPAALLLVVALARGPLDPRYQADAPSTSVASAGSCWPPTRPRWGSLAGPVAAAASLVLRFRRARGVDGCSCAGWRWARWWWGWAPSPRWSACGRGVGRRILFCVAAAAA